MPVLVCRLVLPDAFQVFLAVVCTGVVVLPEDLPRDILPAMTGLLHAWVRRWNLVIPLVCLAAYATSLPNGFAYDDVPVVERNPVLDESEPWWRPWTTPYWHGSNEGDAIDVLYRPLTVQTYAWQRRLLGPDPWSFHLVNVLLHAAVSLGVRALASRLGVSAGAATFAALVFAVHPIHVEAVANVVGRAELLSALGVTSTVLATGAAARARRRGLAQAWTWVGVAAGAVAIFSKESGAAVLVAVAAWRWMQMREGETEQGARVGFRGTRWRSVIAVVLPLLAVFLLYLWARYEVCAGRLTVGGQRGGAGNFLRESDASVRFWSPWAVLGRYGALMLWPDPLLCDYSLNVVLPVRGPLNAHVLLGLLLTALVVAVAVRSLRTDRRWAMVAAGFAASYALPSNLLVHIDVLMAERLFYAPSIWVCLALALVTDNVRRRAPSPDAVAYATSNAAPVDRGVLVATALILALAGRTALRNPAWKDTPTLFAADYARMPPGRRSAPMCAFLGRSALVRGDAAAALAYLDESIAAYPLTAGAHAARGEALAQLDRVRESFESWTRAAELAPGNPEFQRGLEEARERLAGRSPRELIDAARAALARNPDDPAHLRRWAQVNELSDPAESARAYERLVERFPEDVAAWKALAYVRFAAGSRGAAIEAYTRALHLAPDDWEAHTNLAVLLIDRTDAAHFRPDDAVRHARRAVELNPTHWNARVNLAEVLAHCGRASEAADLFDALADQSDPGSTQQKLYRDRAAALR
ncbi:MAG: tetratricopeptide repeat protein [Planctomycetia bacterium]|nr:MAG: tetratricopeptide repeat protein [Planctomycetota bacterium]MBE7458084.1 tetratricopeptide repeat protein [Planctomycetia bacterium]